MAYKQREKKRRKKAAMATARRESRRSGSSRAKWWLTLATKKGACNQCRRVLKVGEEIVYRKEPCEVLCGLCGEGKSYRCSTRWETERGRGRRPVR